MAHGYSATDVHVIALSKEKVDNNRQEVEY